MRNFEHSVGVLVKAYLNDTLQRNNCHACAIGNLIADARGLKYKSYSDPHNADKTIIWDNCDTYGDLNGGVNWYRSVHVNIFNMDICESQAKKDIKLLGYTKEEILTIERAFERSDDEIFNGLMSVVDVLADIHGIDLKEKEEAKLMFVKV